MSLESHFLKLRWFPKFNTRGRKDNHRRPWNICSDWTQGSQNTMWLPNGTNHTVVLMGTPYVPCFQYSLVSEGRLNDIGGKIMVEKGYRSYEKDGQEFMSARTEDGLWKVVVAKDKALSVSYGSIYKEKHESLGHPTIIRDIYKVSPPLPVPKDFNCDTCNNEKFQPSVPPTVGIRTEHPFDKIHSDLSGGFNTPTLGKNEYYMTFTDDYTRYCCIYLL